MKKDIKIIIATHKEFWMPSESCYLPLHVGRGGKERIGDYIGDNTGDNITEKNPYYCELTGLYWAWKNLKADYIGLAHYRRHFSMKPFWYRLFHKKTDCVLTNKEAESLLEHVDVILPKRRNYVIENVYQHYVHTHYPEPLLETEKIISESCPEYMPAFQTVMKGKKAHMFNMYIMKRELSDQYCAWLFPILEELESRVDISDYNAFQARVYGRISELLLDVWMIKNNVTYKEIPVMHMEKVHWFKKITKFLKSKFLKQYY